MKIILSILLCLLALAAENAATSFTEFYCNSTGTNINSGQNTNASPHFFVANQNWDATTGVFTPGVDPSLSNVVAGDWASVYTDGATTPVFIGIVTATNATTITVSLAVKTGTAPSTSATGRSIRIGGAWYGPYWTTGGNDAFPFALVNNLMTNTSQNIPRINLKADRLYAVTNLVQNSNGPIRFEGFASTPGDNEVAKISGATAGAGFTFLTISGANVDFGNFLCESNGVSGSTDGISTATECALFRVSVRGMRRSGFTLAMNSVVECEASTNNLSNSANHGGFLINSAGTILRRCIAHHNSGTQVSGYVILNGATMVDCIAAHNGREGASANLTTLAAFFNCDFYGNVTNGINLMGASATGVWIENCNFLCQSNGYGVTSGGGALRNGAIVNCGFGVGTKANAGGNLNTATLGGILESGSLNYATGVTPWTDPDNGDFRINLDAAKYVGRGQFMQLSAGYTNTIGYPDIGAAQATNAASGTTTVVAYPMFRR